MELRHFRYFVAVAEELSYRKAAERLHVSQPALSKQIKDFELEIGARLLNRSTAHVRLTDAGRVMLDEARALLARAAESGSLAQAAERGRSGRLAIGNIAPLSAGFMAASLAAFRREFPSVDVTLVELGSPEQVMALTEGSLQIGFTTGTSLPEEASLGRLRILTSPLRAAMGKGHPLARRPTVSLGDLSREPILYLSDAKGSPRHINLIRDILSARGLRAGAAKSVSGFDSLVASIASGAGVSLLPAVGGFSRAHEILLRPLAEKGNDLSLELWALWNVREPSQLAQNYIHILRRLRYRRDGTAHPVGNAVPR